MDEKFIGLIDSLGSDAPYVNLEMDEDMTVAAHSHSYEKPLFAIILYLLGSK